MNSNSVPFKTLAKMPTVHLFASPACNLSCAYCSQLDHRRARVGEDALADPGLLRMMTSWPPTHFYLSGGEPFYHKSLYSFLKSAKKHGHIVSFDTNGVVSLNDLRGILEEFPADFFGLFNITHHLSADISYGYILKRALLIRNNGLRVFVKYIGIPENIDEIRTNMHNLGKMNVGSAVTIFQTFKDSWNGRFFPDEYSDEELWELLNLVTLKSHGLQFFGGIHSEGKPCRGGRNFVCYNMHGDRGLSSCCHSGTPIHWTDTYWGGEKRKKKKCATSYCLGDIMFILGIHGITDELENFEKICAGAVSPCGIESVLNYCSRLNEKYKLIDQFLFNRFLKAKLHSDKKQIKNVTRESPPAYYISSALWNQRKIVSRHRDRLQDLIQFAANPNDLAPYQWGQLYSLTLEFRPDLIIEIGRGQGSSTMLFTEVANRLIKNRSQVLSVCKSKLWPLHIAPRLYRKMGKKWFDPLKVLSTSLRKINLSKISEPDSRILVFWRSDEPETIQEVLKYLFPQISAKRHLVIVHGITDARYQGGNQRNSYRFWTPKSNGVRLRINEMDTAQGHIIPIVDFTSRNRIKLRSAEHDLRSGIIGKGAEKQEWLINNWGRKLFSLQAHWYWFTINEKNGALCFPE